MVQDVLSCIVELKPIIGEEVMFFFGGISCRCYLR
nr:MAG TPA: hypothetical protein [Caudoviricetes sp.]